MPTYVYECRTCEKSFEADQSIKDAPLTDCECGGTVRRVIQPVGIAFKGSGFYVNDSVAKPAAEKTTTDKPAETKPEATPTAVETPAPAAPVADSKPSE